MNADFRLDADFVDHPKTRKLIRALGAEALRSLLRLWGFAAKNRPSGVLTGMTDEDLELAADWPDSRAGEFVKALLAVRFLDRDGDVLSLHNWAMRQPFLADREARSEQARKAARARWNGHGADAAPIPTVCAVHAASMHGACDQHADRYARSDPDRIDPDRSVPDHSKIDSSRINENQKKNIHPAADAADGAPSRKFRQPSKAEKARQVFGLWCETVKRLPKPQRLSDRWITHAAARFDEYGLERLREVFQRLDRSNFANAGNWADFEFCIKSDANCEKILSGKYDNHDSPTNGVGTVRGMDAVRKVQREETAAPLKLVGGPI